MTFKIDYQRWFYFPISVWLKYPLSKLMCTYSKYEIKYDFFWYILVLSKEELVWRKCLGFKFCLPVVRFSDASLSVVDVITKLRFCHVELIDEKWADGLSYVIVNKVPPTGNWSLKLVVSLWSRQFGVWKQPSGKKSLDEIIKLYDGNKRLISFQNSWELFIIAQF
jgi:hypothetical protein